MASDGLGGSAAAEQGNTVHADTVKVWDGPTRLFHWGLVLMILLLWLTGVVGGIDLPLPGGQTLMNMDFHMLLGQGVLALVLYRILWGFVGSSTARFSTFVRGPQAVLGYLKAVRNGKYPRFFGHNPAGALMILGLLAALLLQTGTGLFANDDILSEGPLAGLVGKDLSDTLTGVHGLVFNLLMALVIVHIAAAIVYRLKGENLIKPMVTGRKPREQVPAGEAPKMVSALLAVVLLALSVGAVFYGLPSFVEMMG